MNLLRNRATAPNRNDFLFPLEREFDKFFDQFFKKESLASIGQNSGFPKINAYEKDNQLVLTVAVSGMTSEDINVEIDNDNILTISGRMSEEYHSPEGSINYLRELRSSYFERSLKLPENIQGDPKANLKDGILSLIWEIKVENKNFSNKKKINISTQTPEKDFSTQCKKTKS